MTKTSMSAESPRESTGRGDRTTDPFGAPAPTRFGKVVRIGAVVLVLIAASSATYFLSDSSSPADDPMAGHDHGAAAVDPAGPTPVAMTHEQAARIGVTYATVSRRPVTRDVRAVGIVTMDEARVVDLSLKVDGWVEVLHVNVTGQRVERGAPLLALYSPMLIAAQEELLLARRLSDQVSGADETARTSASELLTSARARLAFWDVSADEIAAIEREGRVRRTVTFPSRASGTVIEKRVVEGQRVMAGEALLRIADLSAVWVEADVFAQDLSAVRLGQQVDVEFEGFESDRRRARITFMQPTVDPQSRTVRVRVELPNGDRRLLPGMYATLRFSSSPGAVLSVPRSAVLATGERALVFVRMEDGTLDPREVRLGRQSDLFVEILSGVRLGDTVVSSATFLVDAESNLRSLVGGGSSSASMPGMNMEKP